MFTVLCSSFFFGETSRKLLSPASGVQNESKWCFWHWPRFSLVTWHMSVHFRIPAPGCTKFCTAKLTGWKFVTGLWSHSKKLMINSSHDNRYFTYRKVFTCHLAHVSTFHAPQLLVTCQSPRLLLEYDLWWYLLLSLVTSHSWAFSWPEASRQQQYPRKELK